MKPDYASFRFWAMSALAVIGSLVGTGVIACPADGCSQGMHIAVQVAGFVLALGSYLGWTAGKAYVQANMTPPNPVQVATPTAAPVLDEAKKLGAELDKSLHETDPDGATLPPAPAAAAPAPAAPIPVTLTAEQTQQLTTAVASILRGLGLTPPAAKPTKS